MCGWCVEGLALEILGKERSGRFPKRVCGDEMGRWFYLREAGDFPRALKRMKQSLIGKKLVLSEKLPATVVLLRCLEILVTGGFASPLYQHLVRQDLIRNLIIKACENCPQSAFTEATQPLDIPTLASLYEPATYLTEAGAQELQNVAQLIPACKEMLRHYHSWWLMGRGLWKNDLDERMAETGILDPIEDIAQDQHERFYLLLRAIYFSILLIGRFPAGSKVLRQLVRQHPAGVPWFSGDDLWLQRVAALRLYDLRGFDFFLEYLSEFRATVFYYIDLQRGFTTMQKQHLLAAAQKKSQIMRTDSFMSIEEWLSVSSEGS